MRLDEYDPFVALDMALSATCWYLSWGSAVEAATRYARYTGKRQRVGRNALGVWLFEAA